MVSASTEYPLTLSADELELVPPGLLLARGNVRIFSSLGEIQSESLEYSSETGLVHIPNSALVSGTFFSFTAMDLSFHLAGEEGNFQQAMGVFQIAEGGQIFFSADRGNFQSRTLHLSEVTLAPYSPVEKSLIRLHISAWTVQLDEKWTLLENADFYLFGSRWFRLKKLRKSLKTSESLFPAIVGFGFHPDSGLRFSLNTQYSFSPFFSSTWEIGGMTKKDWLGSAEFSYKQNAFLLYGRRFQVNDFYQGSLVLFRPSAGVLFPISYRRANFLLRAEKQWLEEKSVSGERNILSISARLPIAKFGKDARLISAGWMLREENERDGKDSHRNYWNADLQFERRKRESLFVIGCGQANENRSSPWVFARNREWNAISFWWQNRVSPHWEIGGGAQYDWKRHYFLQKHFMLGYHYRGLIFYLLASPETAGLNLWLGIEGF